MPQVELTSITPVTTFDQEVELIWSQKWSGISVLYLIVRQRFAIVTVPQIDSFQTRYVGNATFIMHNRYHSDTPRQVGGLRGSLWKSGDKRVLWALTFSLAILAGYWTAVNAHISNLKSVVFAFQATHLFETCRPVLKSTPPLWLSAFICVAFAFETLVFGLSMLQGVRFVREKRRTRRDIDRVSLARHMWKTRRDLASVLLRDSILFPFINLMLAMLTILVWAAKLSADFSQSLRVVSAALVPIVGCRLILNLRDAYYKPFHEEYNQSRYQDNSFVIPGLSAECTGGSRQSTAGQPIGNTDTDSC
ncbi:hypothetical protein BKA70DRAFT_1431533 [Coprinopsis sp. MPI-PUGE-AT-0042]|nr:hypothetical protein BKA70DRAFT_1431533 [Coprinopsis sp. MPI-PUGE-AT-0042]